MLVKMNLNYKVKIIILILLMSILSIFTSISFAVSENQNEITYEINSNVISREVYINLQINVPQDISFKINTYKAKINYNKDIFEELNANSFENLSNWENLQFNKENQEIIATKKEGIKDSEEVVKIKFKLKDSIEKNISTEIEIINVQLPNAVDDEVITLESKKDKVLIDFNVENDQVEENTGNEISNTTDNEFDDKKQGNEIENQIITNDKNYEGNNEINNQNTNLVLTDKETSNKNNNANIANKIIPQLGENTIILKIIAILLIAIFALSIFKHSKGKKVISSILIIFLVTQLSVNFVSAINGDIDENNNINLKDIIKLEEHLIDLKTIDKLDNADINRDNKVDLVDLSLLLDLYYYPEIQNENGEIKLETKQLGMGGFGMLFSPKISPFDSNTMVCLSDMGGLYISHNKGETWDRKELRGAPYTVYFDPNTEGVIYAGGSGLYRSTDNGETFEMIFPREEQLISSINRFEDIQRLLYPNIDYEPSKFVQSVAVESGNSNHIAVILYNNKKGFIYESTDNGQNFSEIASFVKDKESDSIYYDNMQLFFTNGKIRYMIQDGIFECGENHTSKEIYKSTTMIDDLEIIEENGETYYILLEENNKGHLKSKLRYTKDFIEFTDLTQKLEDDIKTSYINWEDKEVSYDIDLRHVVATSLSNMYFTQDRILRI